MECLDVYVVNKRIYSWASDSCWTSLKRRGDRMDPCAVSDFNWPIWARCFLISRETRTWGRCCHSFITSFGVLTYNMVFKQLLWILYVSDLFAYLVALQSIEQRHANNSCSDASVVCKRREVDAFHFNIYHAETVNLVKVVHFIRFSKITESTIQTTLSCKTEMQSKCWSLPKTR